MLDFRPVTVADKPLFEKYSYLYGGRNCDMAFANVFCWASFYRNEICESDGFLLMRIKIDGRRKTGYFEPLGEGDIEHAVRLLADDAAAASEPLRLQSLSQGFAERLSGMHLDKELFVFENRDFFDYIYPAESLRTLSGKKLQPKRNHINQFMREYEYRYEALTPAHGEEVFSLLHKWREGKNSDNRSLEVEENVIRTGMENFDALGLRGGALYVNGRMIAFTYGSPINDETFCIHIEKADTEFESAFPMINRLFVNSLPEKYRHINREEDLGLKGLRGSKLSYHPEELYKKFYAIERDSTEMTIWRFLENGFNADASNIASYISAFYEKENVFILNEGEIPAAAIFIHRLKYEYGSIPYICAVTVMPQFKKRGLGIGMVKRALLKMFDAGEAVVMSRINCNRLKNLASSLGFACAGEVSETGVISVAYPFIWWEGNEEKETVFRVVNAKEYLQRYVGYFPDTETEIVLHDDIIDGNCGSYVISGGRVSFTPGSGDGGITPYGLFRLLPLAGKDFIFED